MTAPILFRPKRKKSKVVDKDGNEIPEAPQVLLPMISRLFIIGMPASFAIL